jgi:pimeloyl-ACP methyl ester carboxylesterase
MYLFHPRPEWGSKSGTDKAEQDILIPVEGDILIGGRFHMAADTAPSILFFHGNGEIVADYDQLGPIYNRIDINFLPVDYRGYGRSTGEPTVTAMMRDCHMIFEFVEKWLRERHCSGPLIVMGRSLGSASALELAVSYKNRLHGLILESGFAYAGPLLRLLGVDVNALGFKEEDGFRNVDKIRSFEKAALIIHAEKDHIIPFADGQALYDSCPSDDKTLLQIPGANHNDIFLLGLTEYMAAIKVFVDKIGN